MPSNQGPAREWDREKAREGLSQEAMDAGQHIVDWWSEHGGNDGNVCAWYFANVVQRAIEKHEERTHA